MQCISFLWPPFEAGYRHHCRIITLVKMMLSVLHDHDVADKPYRTNVMIITCLIISNVEFFTCLNQVNDFYKND